MTLGGLGFDTRNAEGCVFESDLEALSFRACANVEAIDLLAIRTDEAGRERRTGFGLQKSFE